jgi:RNase P/RNase MRP subunit p29
MPEQFIRSRLTWPTGNSPIGWGTEAGRVRFHAEDTFEVEEDGKTKVITKARTFFVEVPIGQEIEVEGVKFWCRTLEEREEHRKWEAEILSGGKAIT